MTVPNAAQPRFFQLGTTVDPSTLDRKMLMGYQGWFACAGRWFADEQMGALV